MTSAGVLLPGKFMVWTYEILYSHKNSRNLSCSKFSIPQLHLVIGVAIIRAIVMAQHHYDAD